MWKLALICFTFGYVKAQQCNFSSGPYMACIKTSLDSTQTYRSLENELGLSFISSADQCVRQFQCQLPQGGWEADILGDDGPLADCTVCKKFAKVLTRLYLEAEPSRKRCFRGVIREAIGRQMKYCVNNEKQSGGGIDFPPLPDFDAAGDDNVTSQLVLDNTLKFITAYYTFDERCGQNGDSAIRCLNSPHIGSYPQHCGIRGNCLQNSGPCLQRLLGIESFGCECMREKKQFLQSQIDQIESTIRSAQQNQDSQECTRGVLRLLSGRNAQNPQGTINWVRVANQAIGQCAGGSVRLPGAFTGGQGSQQFSGAGQFQKIVKFGCGVAVRPNASGKILKVAIQVARYFIDALFFRVERFCPTHCQ